MNQAIEEDRTEVAKAALVALIQAQKRRGDAFMKVVIATAGTPEQEAAMRVYLDALEDETKAARDYQAVLPWTVNFPGNRR